MTPHTPGPWKLSIAGIVFAEPSPEDPQDTITIVDAYSTTPANARLIAAAPEMLAVLRDLFEVVETWNEDTRNLEVERLWEALRETRALLARIDRKE